jgi:hypothetical protein
LGRRAEVELVAAEKRKVLEFNSQKQMDEQRHSMQGREAALEQRLLERKEAAEKRGHVRTTERFNRQDQSVMLTAREQRLLMEASKVFNTPQSMLTYQPNFQKR